MNGASIIQIAVQSAKRKMSNRSPIHELYPNQSSSSSDEDFADRDLFKRKRLERRNAVHIDESVNLQRMLESYIVLKNLATHNGVRISCCNRMTANPQIISDKFT